MDKIKVIIVDDHDTYRYGVRMNIELSHPDITVVGEAKSVPELFKLLETVGAADVVLLDIKYDDTSGMTGIDAARRLRAERPEIKILAVSAENASETITEMLEIGIEGFINKANSTIDTAPEAIRSIIQGLEFFGRDISAIISRTFLAKTHKTKDIPEFTEQEIQIIEYSHEGLPAKLIADRMGIAVKTLEWHKSKIFRKLNINNSAELVRYGLKHDIIRIGN